MIETLTRNGRYFIYALLFYCIVNSLNWVSSRSSVEQESQICQKSTLPQHQSFHSQEFPLKIWQTAKTGVSALEEDVRWRIQSWLHQNPKHRYEMITDGSSETYVKETFAHTKPEVVRDFLSLQDPVLRADLLRYLLLYGDGGIYTDLDTICLKPFTTWIPPAFTNGTSLIIGIEGDSLGGPLIQGFSHPVGLGQWTLAAKPNHPILDRVITSVLSRLRALAESQNGTLSTLTVSYRDVIDTTGPGAFTDCLYHELSLATGTNVSSTNLTGLTQPVLIADVLILPVTAFANGVPHSNAKGSDDEDALVQHLFVGSWKGSHPYYEEIVVVGNANEAESDSEATIKSDQPDPSGDESVSHVAEAEAGSNDADADPGFGTDGFVTSSKEEGLKRSRFRSAAAAGGVDGGGELKSS